MKAAASWRIALAPFLAIGAAPTFAEPTRLSEAVTPSLGGLSPMRACTRRASLLFILFPLLASGASFIVPSDRDLIQAADAIAVVTVESQRSYRDAGGLILTEYVTTVSEAQKGPLSQGDRVVITEIGGAVGELALISSSAPHFVTGQRTLVFLDRLGENWTTHSGLLGKFDFVRDRDSASFLIRGGSEGQIHGWDAADREHIEKSRDAESFLQYVRAVARGEAPDADYFEKMTSAPLPGVAGKDGWVTTHSTFPGQNFLIQFAFQDLPVRGARWPTSSISFQTFATQTGSAGAIVNAPAAWTNDPTSDITIAISGTAGAFNYDEVAPNSVNVLNFGVADSFPPLAGNVVGKALIWVSSGTHNFGGETYFNALECDIVIENGLTTTIVDEVVAHEMGHCLGFRHSNEGPLPNTGDALMNSFAVERGSSLLGGWDREAANEVYGDGSCVNFVCGGTAPAVPTNVTATATGASSVSVSWNGTVGATYEVQRVAAGGATVVVGTSMTGSLMDNTASPNTAYLYTVRGFLPSTSAFGTPDLATTVIFTDPVLAAGTTPIKAVHVAQLRTAVNAVRVLAGLGATSFTDAILGPTIPVNGVHLTELRTSLTLARSGLALAAPSYTDGVPTGIPIKAVHLGELRGGVQ